MSAEALLCGCVIAAGITESVGDGDPIRGWPEEDMSDFALPT